MSNHRMKKADASVIDWLNCIWLTDLPSNSKLIACYLRKFMNSQKDIAYPSYARMIEETGLSRGCIAKHLAILEAASWISRESASGLNTTYTIKFPKLIEDGIKNITCSLSELVHQMDTPCSPDEHLPVHQMDTNKQSNKQVSKQVDASLVLQGFNNFWLTWSNCKKDMDVKNTSSKSVTLEKFKKIFNKSYFENNPEQGFKSEIESMCKFAEYCHSDKDNFNPYKNMQTGKFLTCKGWRD